MKDIAKEVAELVKNRSDVLKLCNVSDMLHFNQKTIAEKLQQKVPVLYELLDSIIPEKRRKSMFLLTSLAVLLYGRSQRLNLVQFIIGLVLQKCGLSKQVNLYME